MKHSSIDPYLEGDGLLHRRDPRAKLLVVLVLVVALALVPVGGWVMYGLFSLVVIIMTAVARVSLIHLLRRVLVVVPFVLPAVLFLPFLHGGEVLWQIKIGYWHLAIGHTGLVLAGSIVLKAMLSALTLGLLVTTTRITDLLVGLDKLGVPHLLTTLFGFMYRYLFVLSDEALRLKSGRDARYCGGFVTGIRSVGHMTGSIFLRSYDRAERVYGAMLLRGYDGNHCGLNQLRMGRADILMVATVVVIAASTILAARLL